MTNVQFQVRVEWLEQYREIDTIQRPEGNTEVWYGEGGEAKGVVSYNEEGIAERYQYIGSQRVWRPTL